MARAGAVVRNTKNHAQTMVLSRPKGQTGMHMQQRDDLVKGLQLFDYVAPLLLA